MFGIAYLVELTSKLLICLENLLSKKVIFCAVWSSIFRFWKFWSWTLNTGNIWSTILNCDLFLCWTPYSIFFLMVYYLACEDPYNKLYALVSLLTSHLASFICIFWSFYDHTSFHAYHLLIKGWVCSTRPIVILAWSSDKQINFQRSPEKEKGERQTKTALHWSILSRIGKKITVADSYKHMIVAITKISSSYYTELINQLLARRLA